LTGARHGRQPRSFNVPAVGPGPDNRFFASA